jgi:hypothetical protein
MCHPGLRPGSIVTVKEAMNVAVLIPTMDSRLRGNDKFNLFIAMLITFVSMNFLVFYLSN